MLERSTVINRLLAIGMLGAMGLMLAPEPAWGQSALKEKPPGHSHRFPPLPDKIQRLDAYRQRRERAGLLSKFVYWAAEAGSEPTGTIIIDMPSSGPVKVMPDGEPTWVSKPGITITPTEGQPKTTLRVVPGKNTRPVDSHVKQVSTNNTNQLVHELVVPAANDPSLPPLPDQVQPLPPRKPKVPMIRRVPELSSDNVDSAIQTVSNEEKIETKDLPPVRGTKPAAPTPSAVVAATVPPEEPTLRPLVLQEKPKVVQAKPKIVQEKPKVVQAKPTVATEKPKAVTTNSVPRQLPNLSPEKISPDKKVTPKPAPKTVVKKQTTPTPKPSSSAARATVANNSRRHPSSVRSSDIRRTSADSTHAMNSTAVPIPSKTSEKDESPAEAKPRDLPGLAESKELPPIPSEAEVMENQRKFEEALRKAAKKPVETTVESAPTELTLPTDPIVEENTAPPIEFANDEPAAPAVEEAAPTPVVETTVPETAVETKEPAPVVETVMPAPAIEATMPEPVVEPTMPSPVLETMAPAPVLETVAPTPVVETVAPAPVVVETVAPTPVVVETTTVESAPATPATPEMPEPVVMEQAPAPTPVTVEIPKATNVMSEEEALAKLEANVPAVEEMPTVAEPPVVPSQRVTSTEPAPIPLATMPPTVQGQVPNSRVPNELLEARSELESLAQGVAIPSTAGPNLDEAKLELEALVQGRPIPRTTTPAAPAVIPNELMQAEEELAALTRQKQTQPAPVRKKTEMPLPSELPRTVMPVPKATSSTAPKVVPVPAKPAPMKTAETPAPKVEEAKQASTEKAEPKKTVAAPNADPTKISSLPKTEPKKTVSAPPVAVPTAEPQKTAAMPRAEPKKTVSASKPMPTKTASAPKATPVKTVSAPKAPSMKPTVAPKAEPAKVASAPKSSPNVNQSIADKMTALPDLPPQVEAAPVMPADMANVEPTLPGPKLASTKPSAASDRPALKSNDVTELAEEIKKAKKPSPNPFSFISKEKGAKNSGMASQPTKPVTPPANSTNAPKEMLADDSKPSPTTAKSSDAAIEPRSTAPVAPTAVASTSPATKPLTTETATPPLSPLPNPVKGTEVVESKAPVSPATALPSASSLPSPPAIDPVKPIETASKDGPPKKGAEQVKNPTAPLPGGLTFGLHAIEDGFLEATKPSKELVAPIPSNAGQQAEGKKSPLSPPRFDVSKIETFDDPTDKSAAKTSVTSRPSRSPSLKPAELVSLVPDQQVVVESPAAPAPFDQDIAGKLITAMKNSADCQGSMQELAQMEYWYRAPGAVDAVGNIARTHSDIAVRVNALKVLGTAPTTMAEATSTLRSLARDAKEPNIRQAAEAVLVERTAATPRPSLR